MTASEAHEKWCPFGRTYAYANDTAVTVNENDARGSTSARCIASGCMAWRWESLDATVVVLDKPPHGFCGLAGRTA